MHILRKLHLDKEPLYGAYSGCDWVGQTQDHQLSTINPSDETILATIYTANAKDIDEVILKASQAFEQWKMVPAPKRGELIACIGQELRENKDVLSEIIVLEAGKTSVEALGEVQEMIDMADFAVGQSRMLYGSTMHSERPFHRLYEQWHPYGVVGVVTSFNFPMAVWAWNAFIAAVAGNTVIWKPSTKTPLCALAVMRICQKVLEKLKLPAVFSLIIPESRKLSQQLIEDKRVALLSFTGSSDTGKAVGIQVASRFGRCILELGGNNAVILDETANLDLAIPAIVFGAVGTAGQRCTSTRRVFVPEQQMGMIEKQLIQAYSQIKIGNPLQKDYLMGPLIDKAAVDLYRKTIHDIQSAYGKIIFGGRVLDQPGFFVEPTLIKGLDNIHPLVQRETFVPILYLFPYVDLKDAIRLQNQVPQGLSSSLFTESYRNAEYFLSTLGSDCGIANINVGTSGAEITGAFGGEKATGGGREAGSDAWKSYMRRQTNTLNWGTDLPLAQGISFKLK